MPFDLTEKELSLWISAALVALYISHLWFDWLPPTVVEYLEDAGDD